MNIQKQLLEEIKERGKEEKKTNKQLIAIEQAIYKDLLHSEGKCRKCGRTENLTLDHIVPKTILQSFGVDTFRESVKGNYQLLCKPCNTFKSGRLDFSSPETKPLLIGLLEKL